VNPIAIMQGRLSPPSRRRLQAFPWDSWPAEFAHAGTLGFDGIEWLFEDERHDENPLWTVTGRCRIQELIDAHAVPVRSVCADYFMVHPFFRVGAGERERSIEVLRRLIQAAADVGAGTILLPVLEIAEIRDEAEADLLTDALRACVADARAAKIRLGLETELVGPHYAALVARVGDPVVGAYYDIGNAAAGGHDLAADVRALGTTIVGVHVKDRRRAGGSVPLGQGAADFVACFRALREVEYGGSLVLQTAFGDDYLGCAAVHRRFVQDAWQAVRSPAR
jgi:L-ribulose-5-phosphate 3-epimerase